MRRRIRPPIVPAPGQGRLILLTLGLLLYLIPALGSSEEPPEQSLPESVHSAAQAQVEAGHYQSLIIGVREGDTVSWHRFGEVHEGGPPPSPDTLFEIGSLTKPFTAALLALAEEQGDIQLDAPLAKLGPETLSLNPRLLEQVTPWHLITHVSGLPNTPDDLAPRDPSRLFEDYDQAQLLDFLSGFPLATEPESHFSYSNLGYALIGYLLSHYYERSLDTLLEEEVLRPLGLSDTQFRPGPSQTDRLAPGFDYDLRRAPAWDMPAFEAAGALKSSPRDLLAWTHANLNPSGDALGKALARLSQSQLTLGDSHFGMALGWHLIETDQGQMAWHEGRTAGYASFAGFDPMRDRAVVILANTGNSLRNLGFAALGARDEVPPIREAIQLEPRLGALYAGRYRMSPGFVVTVRQREDGLYIQAPGRPALRLYALDHERFFTRGVESEVTFDVGEDGAIDSLRITTPEGMNQRGHRMTPTEHRASREVQAADPEYLARYGGHYRLGESLDLHVKANGERLLVETNGGPAQPLYPAPDGRFFHRNRPLELYFPVGPDGEPNGEIVLYRNGYRLKGHRQRAEND